MLRNDKKFSVKDFITYISPCICCNNLTTLRLCIVDTNRRITQLTPAINGSKISVDLKMTYLDNLKLEIDCLSNSFTANNQEKLIGYLLNHTLSFQSQCGECTSVIGGESLHFNLEKNFIRAFNILDEYLFFCEGKTIFALDSSLKKNASRLTIGTKNSYSVTTVMHLPLMFSYCFKNREQMFSKLKLYLTFS